MRVRNWALAAAAVLLLVVAIIPAQMRSKRGGASRAATPGTSGQSDAPRNRRRIQVPGPDGGTVDVDDADAGVKTPIPDLHKVSGSCLQEDTKQGQLCTDFFAGPEEMDRARLQCRQTRRYPNAAWSDAPCDHLTSHGGCWSSKVSPARVRWFYGTLHADFRPGPDTHRVCGAFALGFKPDGTPVKSDGVTPEPGATARPDDADPENP